MIQRLLVIMSGASTWMEEGVSYPCLEGEEGTRYQQLPKNFITGYVSHGRPSFLLPVTWIQDQSLLLRYPEQPGFKPIKSTAGCIHALDVLVY